MANRQQIAKILSSMSHLPNAPHMEDKEQAERVVDLYLAVIGHLSDDLLRAAVIYYVSTSTFFPTPGDLNNKALDLQMLAMEIPTPAEAWSMVLASEKFEQAVVCAEGEKLRHSAIEMVEGEYWTALDEIRKHEEQCSVCHPARETENFGHPIVAETVRLMGGRRALFTDNLAADRKQFIDAYRERVEREIRRFGMLPDLKRFISSQRIDNPVLAGITTVADRLGKNRQKLGGAQ